MTGGNDFTTIRHSVRAKHKDTYTLDEVKEELRDNYETLKNRLLKYLNETTVVPAAPAVDPVDPDVQMTCAGYQTGGMWQKGGFL